MESTVIGCDGGVNEATQGCDTCFDSFEIIPCESSQHLEKIFEKHEFARQASRNSMFQVSKLPLLTICIVHPLANLISRYPSRILSFVSSVTPIKQLPHHSPSSSQTFQKLRLNPQPAAKTVAQPMKTSKQKISTSHRWQRQIRMHRQPIISSSANQNMGFRIRTYNLQTPSIRPSLGRLEESTSEEGKDKVRKSSTPTSAIFVFSAQSVHAKLNRPMERR